jgi:hypothetical protein
MIGVRVKHQTLLLLRHACSPYLRSRNRCITDITDHSPVTLDALAHVSLHEYMPREAAEGRFQETCVRRVHRVLSGRGTGEGVASQRSSISAGLAIKLAESILLPPRYEQHMHAVILLAIGPRTRAS